MRVIVFGAGLGGVKAWMALSKLADVDVAGFVDSDPAKRGTSLCGLPVHEADDLRTLEYDRLLVASVRASEIRTQLAARGVPDDRVLVLDPSKDLAAQLRAHGVDVRERLILRRAPTVRVAICGAGMGGLRAWERLAPNPVLEIVTFVDRDPRRRESSFLGVPVVPMAGFDPGDVDAIVMASMHAEAIARQLLSHGAQPARIYTLPLFEWLLRVRAANPATAMTGSGPLKECESWVV